MNAEDASGTEDSSCAHLETGADKRSPHSHGGSPREGSIRVPIPVAVVFVVIITVLVIALVALSVGKYNCPGIYEPLEPVGGQHLSSVGGQHLPCPREWVSSGGKCYFFSTTRNTWPSAHSSCSKEGAALAVVDSAADMVFFKRRVGSASHWIGVHSHPGRRWKEETGQEVNNRFSSTESEGCAFLNRTGVGRTDCEERMPWICSKDLR